MSAPFFAIGSAMMKMFQAAAVLFGLLIYSAPSMAMMHGMKGMSEPGMYNLTIGGLAENDDAKGIDEKFREMTGVDKVHVDFENGMIMVWMKDNESLDQGMAEKIIEGAGFALNAFEHPK
jgi:hypothetical protein